MPSNSDTSSKEIAPLKYTAILLCGGASSRMGTSKENLQLGSKQSGNQTMLQRTLSVLESTVENIIICANSSQQFNQQLEQQREVTQAHTQIHNDKTPFEGPLKAISGLAQQRVKLLQQSQGFFITSCDMPLLTKSVFQFLKKQFEKSLIETVSETVPKGRVIHFIEEQQTHPFPCVCGIDSLLEIPEIENQGARSMKRFLKQSNAIAIPIQETEFSKDHFLNVNNPNDFKVAKQLLLNQSFFKDQEN